MMIAPAIGRRGYPTRISIPLDGRTGNGARSGGGAGALGGSFWGLLFGLIFFVPLLGMAVGAAMGALSGSMADVGIDDDFIRGVRQQVTPGTSALFVMSSNAVADKVLAEFRTTGASLLSTNLSGEQEARLREAFAEGE